MFLISTRIPRQHMNFQRRCSTWIRRINAFNNCSSKVSPTNFGSVCVPSPSQPFKSDYTVGSSTSDGGTQAIEPTVQSADQTVTASERTQTHGVDVIVTKVSATPDVGRPYGSDKPRRVIIRGKISK